MTDSEWAALRKRMIGLATARFGPEDAEDIVQEVLRRFFTTDRQNVCDLPRYLNTAVVREGASSWRDTAYRARVAEKCERELVSRKVPSPVDIVDGRARLAAVTEMLGSAGVDVMLSYTEDGYQITARHLGISGGHLRVIVHSVRAMLRGDGNRFDRSRLGMFRRLAESAAA